MKTFSFDVVVFDGPSSSPRSETVFHTVLKAESVFSAVCSLTGIFSACTWFAVRAYVNFPDSNWLQYVTLYDNENGFSIHDRSSSFPM